MDNSPKSGGGNGRYLHESSPKGDNLHNTLQPALTKSPSPWKTQQSQFRPNNSLTAQVVPADNLLISQPNDTSSTVGTRLEKFLEWRIEIVNTRQPHLVLSSNGFSSAFRVTFASGRTGTLKDRVNNDIRILEQHPKAFLKSKHAATNLDLIMGTAEVYSDVRMYECPPGVVHQVLVVSRFMCVEGRWVCVKAVDIRGLGGCQVEGMEYR